MLDDQAADDLVHDVILQTIDSLRAGKVREPERLAGFVLGSCRMAVQNLRRGAARRARILATYGEREEGVHASDGAADVDSKRLEGCLEQLAARERTVLVLTFYAERSSDEIARELSLSVGNVRVIRHRALAGL